MSEQAPDTIQAMGKHEDANREDPQLAALAEWLETSRKEWERFRRRYEASVRRFEIAHRRLSELARRA